MNEILPSELASYPFVWLVIKMTRSAPYALYLASTNDVALCMCIEGMYICLPTGVIRCSSIFLKSASDMTLSMPPAKRCTAATDHPSDRSSFPANF